MTVPNSFWSTLGLALLVALVTVAAVGPPVSAQSTAEPAFIVTVQSDGSAEVSVRSTFDLTTDAEQQAFRSLMNDEEAQENAKARFLDRMRTVASDAENATGREMRVTDPAIDLTRTADNETGIVTLSVSWSGLAASEGDRLVVTEPFASGFTPERTFILRAPDGYTIGSTSPEPTSTDQGMAVWRPGTELAGFSVELHPASESAAGGEDQARSNGQPGFGMTVAIVAVLTFVGTLVARRGSRSDQ